MDILQSKPGLDPVTVSSILPVSPQRIFRAWTDPDELIKWFGPRPNSLLAVNLELRVGGPWCFVLADSTERKARLEGEYLEIDPDKKLVFSWSHVEETSEGHLESTVHSRVTVNFTAVDQGTRIDLCHENIQAEDGRLGVGKGWQACFTHLHALCKNREQES